MPKPKILTQSEINKKIISKPAKTRDQEDLLGPFGRYNDENYSIYKKKRKQFYEACNKYNRMNQDTLISSKRRLHEDYLAELDCEFLNDVEGDNEEALGEEKHISRSLYIRKRTEREIHQVPSQNQVICSLEPWFCRYLILNKFIWAARTIVIRNRLLKVLGKLRELDEEKIESYEKGEAVFNVSYREVFQKFLS